MIKQRNILNLTELILMAVQWFSLVCGIIFLAKIELLGGFVLLGSCVSFYICRFQISEHLKCDRYEIEYLNRAHKRAIYRKLGVKKRY